MSGFMSFLKKMGQILSVGLELTGIISPAVLPLFGSSKAGQVAGKAVNDFTAIMTVIIQIETAMQGKPGPEKLAAAVALVQPIIRTAEAVAGHEIANEAEFIAACTDEVNAGVRILNSLNSKGISTTGSPITAVAAPAATPTVAVPAAAA